MQLTTEKLSAKCLSDDRQNNWDFGMSMSCMSPMLHSCQSIF